jgi:hypothetical protein
MPYTEIRLSLCRFAAAYDKFGTFRGTLLIYNNDSKQVGTMIHVVAVREQEDGSPVLQVNWMFHTIAALNDSKRRMMQETLSNLKSDGAYSYTASEKQQRLLVQELERNGGLDCRYQLHKSPGRGMKASYLTVGKPPSDENPNPDGRSRRTTHSEPRK